MTNLKLSLSTLLEILCDTKNFTEVTHQPANHTLQQRQLFVSGVCSLCLKLTGFKLLQWRLVCEAVCIHQSDIRHTCKWSHLGNMSAAADITLASRVTPPRPSHPLLSLTCRLYSFPTNFSCCPLSPTPHHCW